MEATVAPTLLTEPPRLSYGDQLIDPISGLIIPKRLDLNLKWRRELIRSAESSLSTRRQLQAAAAKSPIFWLNLFGFTYRPKKVDATGKEIALTDAATNVPFITWPVQDEAIVELKDAVEKGHDVLMNKSRDMGASWLSVALIQWFWQFRGNTTFLELSRKEALVDRRGSMDSLFEKHRYLLKWQPNWLQPQSVRDTFMHLENRDNGSVIDGESTNDNAGQAGRNTAILLDEFARVPNGEAIDLATADTTACRIFNSTPGAPNAHFTKIYNTKRAKIIELPWWRHPEKGKGAHQIINPDNGKIIWTSPWRDQQLSRRSKRDVAQNIDMEHGRIGDMVFDADDIEKHRMAFGAEPSAVGTLRFNYDQADSVKKGLFRKMLREPAFAASQVKFTISGGTLPLRLWVDLIDGRPPQDDRYVIGADISAGTGSSNSVATVKSHKTGRIVAKLWDSYTPPEAFAEMVIVLAAWVGGRKPPFIMFEKNGPGMQFGKKLLNMSYPSIYYQRNDGTKSEDVTKRWGWHSSAQRKELLVGQYREALKTGKTINPCHEALDEALDYVYDDTGKIVPGTAGTDEGGAGATHGDHVIADALASAASDELPPEKDETDRPAPQGSFADRRRRAIRRKGTEKEAWSR